MVATDEQLQKNIAENIKSEILLKTESENNIVFGVDKNYFQHAVVAITSINKSCINDTYNFHIITSMIQEEISNLLLDFLKPLGHGLTIHYLKKNIFHDFPVTDCFPTSIYYRLLAPKILKSKNKILCLDSDVIIIKPISEIWEMIFEKNIAAFVVEECEHLQADLSKNAKMIGNRYFNSGVIFIDVKTWNRGRISEKSLSLLINEGHNFQYFDQDALNKILEGRIKFIDKKFNTIVKLGHTKYDYTIDVPQETCIIHYTGREKPWQAWNKQFVCKYYQLTLKESIFNFHKLDKPKNRYQAKRLYKLYFRSGNLIKGFWWIIKFYKIRCF